jgi:hypothetical protein
VKQRGAQSAREIGGARAHPFKRQVSEGGTGGREQAASACSPRRRSIAAGLLSFLQPRSRSGHAVAHSNPCADGRHKQQEALRLDVRASLRAHSRGSVAEAREAFRLRVDSLLRPASLLGGDDATMQGLMLGIAFAPADKVSELHRLFFTSPDVLAFATARLHSWGALRALHGAGAAAAGAAAGLQVAAAAGGTRVRWPRRRRVLQRLGLLGSPVDIT